MFQWYKSAVICYAHLSDVDVDAEIEPDIAGSRWFTRGWTLQELIAPREVIFYSNKWQALGSRSTLSAQLATITGIDEPYLLGKPLDKVSIAQRMSWASRRTTTREEDVAYCLLGIFNVNMSLIYGEGSKAFKRLQEILAREYYQDQSLFAWGKLVGKPSDELSSAEVARGPRTMKHDPDKTGKRLLGLLAESPADFQYSGRIVPAPNSVSYFMTYRASLLAPTFVGSIAHIELPVTHGGFYHAFHLMRPPISKLPHKSGNPLSSFVHTRHRTFSMPLLFFYCGMYI